MKNMKDLDFRRIIIETSNGNYIIRGFKRVHGVYYQHTKDTPEQLVGGFTKLKDALGFISLFQQRENDIVHTQVSKLQWQPLGDNYVHLLDDGFFCIVETEKSGLFLYHSKMDFYGELISTQEKIEENCRFLGNYPNFTELEFYLVEFLNKYRKKEKLF